MDVSLPIPTAMEQELEDFAGHNLPTVSSNNDENLFPGPDHIDEGTQQSTYLQAHSWIVEFQKRLEPETFNKFFNILSKCSSMSELEMLETPRVEFAKLFAESNESELWDDFLKSFFQPWKEMQDIEESEMNVAEMMRESRDEIEEVKEILEIAELLEQDQTMEELCSGSNELFDLEDK
ncbi:MAG: hypothetical protein L6R41_003538 [Letrouitia leprolyta]|nr:MAG: hypothetical protein L6R41_003538 [Letrouitia leprolyta]